MVLVANTSAFGERDRRLAVYLSAEDDLRRWRLLGTYSGRARSAAIRGGELWVLFDDGFARAYSLPTADADKRDDTGGMSASDTAATTTTVARLADRGAKFPFRWAPLGLAGDGRGTLWAIGVEGTKLVAARLGPGDDAVWVHSFPAGPEVTVGATGEAKESAARLPVRAVARTQTGVEGGPGGGASSGEPPATGAPRPIRIRAAATGDLYVFWSKAPPGADAESASPGGAPGAIHAARLTVGAGAGESVWTKLPSLPFPHDDFCAGVTSSCAPGVVARPPAPDESEVGLALTELDAVRKLWRETEPLRLESGRFLFGYMPRAACVRRDGGDLILRTNTQRVEVFRRGREGWEAVEAAGRLALILPEIGVLVTIGGGLLLIAVGLAAFVARLLRITGRGPLPAAQAGGAGPPEPVAEPVVAPIAHRALAAMLDVMLVVGAVTLTAGYSEALANPLVPDARSLLIHGAALVLLAIYSAALEAAFGATVGKLAVGLRVERPDGERASLGRILLRNLLRPVDLLPPFLGAVGLASMTMTARRQRLGDLAAGTVVVKGPPRLGLGRSVSRGT